MFSSSWITDGMVQDMRWIPVQAQWGGKMMGFAQTGLESVGKNTRRGGEMLRQLGHKLVIWGKGLESTGLPSNSHISFIL